MEFHPLKVAYIRNLTKKSVQITFDIPEEYKKEYLNFKAGQYLTLDLKGTRRDYSICSSPLDGELTIGVKGVKNGFISKYLTEELKIGVELMVSTPNGRFGIPSKPNEKRTILAFAAGSGITPILSILKYTLQTEEWVNFYLFYSNKTPDSTMFLEELKALQEQYPNNLHLHFIYTQHQMDNWLYEGRLDAHKFELILNQIVDINEVDEALVCGPSEMIKEISNEIFKAGIPKKHIHFELFTPDQSPLDIIPEELEAPDEVIVTVTVDGETSEVKWNREKNLIDALLDADVDAPYSCKGGVCSSCLCKLEEGEVHLGENFVLTDSDLENGMILACISRPKSSSIKINFDDI